MSAEYQQGVDAERARILKIIKATNLIHTCDQYCDPDDYCLTREFLVALIEVEVTE